MCKITNWLIAFLCVPRVKFNASNMCCKLYHSVTVSALTFSFWTMV